VKTIDYPALSPESRQAAIIAANLDGEPMNIQDLVKVPTPAGGGTTWNIDNAGNVENADEIVGLLVGIGKHGVLWPKDDPSEMRPVIVTNDLLVGYRVSDELGDVSASALEKFRIGDRRFDWSAMTNSTEFGYGSGRNGTGKRLKEARILAILRQGETWPILVTIGPGSLRGWQPFQKRLPDFHYACVVGLRLKKEKAAGGQPYSQIVPRLVGTITPEQAEIARKTYVEPLRAMFNAPPIGATVVNDLGDE
jgi:hypothetical protein